jgi:hypothetical protein
MMGMADCNQGEYKGASGCNSIPECRQGSEIIDPYKDGVGALGQLCEVSYVSMFMSEPHEYHQTTVKRILRYIAGMQDHDI